MTIKLGNRLAELRKEHHLSQEELADKLNVSRQAISKWECGESSPDTDNLIELSKIYDISLDELVGNERKDEPAKEIRLCCDNDDKDEDDDHDEDENEEKEHPTYVKVNIIVSSISVFLIITSYLLLGFMLGLWGKAWVLFLLIPIIPSIMDTIFYKNLNKLVYPVIVAFIYLTLCMWYPGGLWHPLWVIFLTIPVYYIIVNGIKKIKKTNKDK